MPQTQKTRATTARSVASLPASRLAALACYAVARRSLGLRVFACYALTGAIVCRPTQQTVLLPKPAPRFWLFANNPKVDARALGIRPDDVLVFLNRAKPFEVLKSLPNRRVLIIRRNAREKNWFIPYGRDKELFSLFEDVLLLSDKALAKERRWFSEYKKATKNVSPTTGWIAYQLLREQYPDSSVVPVNFKPAGDNGSYKWQKHD